MKCFYCPSELLGLASVRHVSAPSSFSSVSSFSSSAPSSFSPFLSFFCMSFSFLSPSLWFLFLSVFQFQPSAVLWWLLVFAALPGAWFVRLLGALCALCLSCPCLARSIAFGGEASVCSLAWWWLAFGRLALSWRWFSVARWWLGLCSPAWWLVFIRLGWLLFWIILLCWPWVCYMICSSR